jgi:hypothetical protein
MQKASKALQRTCMMRATLPVPSITVALYSPGIIDPKTGKSIIAGKKVTGLTTKGEEEEDVLETIKSWHRLTIEAAAASAGATCESAHLLESLVLM